MATSLEWAQYYYLRDRIAEAVDEAIEDNGGWDDGGITVAISPDLTEARAAFLPWWELGDVDGWNIETAHGVEEADEIAGMYFDLR